MPEVENEVAVYEVEFLCDECKKPMKVRSILGSYPVTYEHVCPDGHELILDERYPQIRYRRYEDG